MTSKLFNRSSSSFSFALVPVSVLSTLYIFTYTPTINTILGSRRKILHGSMSIGVGHKHKCISCMLNVANFVWGSLGCPLNTKKKKE